MPEGQTPKEQQTNTSLGKILLKMQTIVHDDVVFHNVIFSIFFSSLWFYCYTNISHFVLEYLPDDDFKIDPNKRYKTTLCGIKCISTLVSSQTLSHCCSRPVTAATDNST